MKKPGKNFLNHDTSILFATFSAWEGDHRLPTNGSVEPLRDFLVPKIKKLVLIDQVVPGGHMVMPIIEEYMHGNAKPVMHPPSLFLRILEPLLWITNRPATVISFKIRDFISVIDWALRDSTVFGCFIGLESINALAGIVLRKFGKVKKVVYYVSDYSPHRYTNKLFNDIYLWLDRFAATHSDYVWDVSLAMQPARIKAGLDPKKTAPVIHVGNGLFPDQIITDSQIKREPHALAYMGTVGPENGPDIAIEALAILRRQYKDAVLHMIGGKAQDFVWLLPIIHKNHLEKAVIHHGFVPKSKDMATIMSGCSVGLAPYRSFTSSARWYGDAGKIRAYCGAGLAIVSSQVPPLGNETASKGAAIIAHDDPESFAKAIHSLFTDSKKYQTMAINARRFAKDNTWQHQFSNAFTAMK